MTFFEAFKFWVTKALAEMFVGFVILGMVGIGMLFLAWAGRDRRRK